MLSTCSPWGRKESDTTERLNWTEYLYPGLPMLFSPSVVSTCLQPHGRQHSRFPCPSPSPEVCSNPCLSSWWCHTTISSFVIPFSWFQSFPASGSFPMSRLFTSVLELQLQHQSFQLTFMDSLILSFLNSLTTLSSPSIYFIPCITVSIWYCFWRFPEGSFKHQNLHLSTTFPNPPLTSGWEWWR